MKDGPKPDVVGEALTKALGYLAERGNPYPRIADFLQSIPTAEGLASEEYIQKAVGDVYQRLWVNSELPFDRTAKVKKVTSQTIERLRSECLLVDCAEVRTAADNRVPAQGSLQIKDDGGMIGDVRV